ncbi:hypothetical protein ACFQGE_02180 [Halomicroarcula sp. GCM10025817]|uniref:hypothetical protein n=1 Tax=Haloarcula TaxID=2237 RepID=UPI0023E7E6E6|nr:hypothetical protein [Halomicroarcula sp. SYNS111]
MLSLKSYIGGAFGRHEDVPEDVEVPLSVPKARLYECADCGTVFIESTRVRCSKCRTGTLSVVE